MPEGAAVEPRILGEQQRHVRLFAKILGLLGVEIVQPVAIDEILPVGPLLRMQWLIVKRKPRRLVRNGSHYCRERGIASQLRQKVDDVAAFSRRHRRRQSVGHQSSHFASFFDIGDEDAIFDAGPRVAPPIGFLRRFALFITLMLFAVAGGESDPGAR